MFRTYIVSAREQVTVSFVGLSQGSFFPGALLAADRGPNGCGYGRIHDD